MDNVEKYANAIAYEREESGRNMFKEEKSDDSRLSSSDITRVGP